MIRLSEDLVLPPDRLAAELESPLTLLGDGLRRYPEHLTGLGRTLPEDAWRARAAVVAAIGWREHAAGRRDPVHEAEPLYRRISSPEAVRARSRERDDPAE